MCVPTLRPVGQEFRVNTAGVLAMATQWGISAGELHATVAPTGLGLARQASAAAVDAAHSDVATFTARLAARVGERAKRVAEVDNSYLTQEASSTATLADLDPVNSE